MKKNYCISYLLLILSSILTLVFVYWLTFESVDESIKITIEQYEQLKIEGKEQQATQFIIHRISNEQKLKLSWLPLIRLLNGYEQLSFYIKLLENNVNREIVYKDIEALILVAPEAFHNEVKPRYLKAISEVKGVHPELLKKYNLQLNVN
jgi:hypothetical protein